jgi:hypothetical protein
LGVALGSLRLSSASIDWKSARASLSAEGIVAVSQIGG